MDSTNCFHPDNPSYLADLMDLMARDKRRRDQVHKSFLDGTFTSLILTTPQQKMLEIIEANDEAMLLASRRLGKSFLGLAAAIKTCAKSHSIVRYFCATQKSLQDIVNDNMSLFLQLAPPGFLDRRKTDYRWIVGPHKSEIRLHSMNSRKDVDASRGGSADLAIFEEISFVDEELAQYAREAVVLPMFARKPRIRMVDITTAADTEEHFVHEVLETRARARGALFKADVYANPHLTPETIEKLREKTSDGVWQREYLCNPFRDVNRVVIPEFSDEAIAEIARPSHFKPLTVIDFGGVRDKTGTVWGYYDTQKSLYRVLRDDLRPSHTSTAEIKKIVLERELELFGYELKNRCADAPGQLAVDLAWDGFSVWLPKKPPGSWEAGIHMVRKLLRERRLVIDPSCKDLILTLRRAMYNTNRTDFQRTEALGHADLLAALMYFVRHASTADCIPDGYGIDTSKQFAGWGRKKKQRNLLSEVF